MIRNLVLFSLGSLLLSVNCPASVVVFLDFTTDAHNGSGGSSNGVADWIDELDQATTAAGVSPFNSVDRSTIEANIKSQLESIYSGYNGTFVTTAPGAGNFERLYFGAETDSGILGFAPLDIGNLFANNQANVGPEEFAFIIESGDTVAQMVTELSTALAGTAAHEFAHSVGLSHQLAYSDAGITPANYSDTGGLQNRHIMATGPSGLDELGRETIRDFSPFEKVMLDITGGAASTFVGLDNESLVTGGIISDPTENGTVTTLGTDAGSALATAQLLSFATGPSSGLDISFVEADLDSASGDVDVFRFSVATPARLLAHVYSSGLAFRTDAEFDPMLELLDSSGTILASNTNVRFSGNTFGAGAVETVDSFLNNISLDTAGTYYLRVTAESGSELGSNYWLVTAFDGTATPEPGSVVLALLASALFGHAQLRRRRKTAAATINNEAVPQGSLNA